MLDIEKVKRDASGRWAGVLSYFGIDTYSGKHGPCPMCGGKDRFRFDFSTERYICNQCGNGDGLDLVGKVVGCDLSETIKQVASMVGTVAISPVVDEDIEVVRNRLNTLWKTSVPISKDGVVTSYLAGRGIRSVPINVRYNSAAFETETKRNMPAMIAKVTDKDGNPVTLHRTFLEISNTGGKPVSKAHISSPRKLVTGIKKITGSAIRLFKESACIGLSEGIETALSAAQIFNIPTWAVLSTGGMKTWEPPDCVKEVVIFGDNDRNFAGQRAAYELANRLSGTHKVEVQIPDVVGDWNDVLVREGL